LTSLWRRIAPRAWRLGSLAAGTIRVDAEALRIALDALLENAVDYTESAAAARRRLTRARWSPLVGGLHRAPAFIVAAGRAFRPGS
jgi:hypothetical protein